MKNDLVEVIKYGNPGKDFALGETLDSLIIPNEDFKRPTKAQLNTWDKELTRQKMLKEVKALASQKILELAPEYKQRNALADAQDSMMKRFLGEELSLEEKNQMNDAKELWRRIRAIRNYSNVLEGRIQEELDASLININDGWPNE